MMEMFAYPDDIIYAAALCSICSYCAHHRVIQELIPAANTSSITPRYCEPCQRDLLLHPPPEFPLCENRVLRPQVDF
ncbi:MAG: hypothetical protein ACPG7F_13715 [Aggregatilineales bacterium]